LEILAHDQGLGHDAVGDGDGREQKQQRDADLGDDDTILDLGGIDESPCLRCAALATTQSLPNGGR